MPVPEKKYCVISKVSLGFVKSISFTNEGVKVEFTRDRQEAARVSIKEAADGLAECVPDGAVRLWKMNWE